MTAATPILFIHGMYMTGHSWQPWVSRAAAAGFDAQAPSWPFHDADPAELRRSPDPRLGRLRFGDVVDHHKRLIDAMPARPHLVGHSIGGLAVQKLVNDGYAARAVAVSPAPARGVVSLSPHFLAANFPHVNPLAGNRPAVMTARRFKYTFGNTVDEATSNDLFSRFVVPESRNVPRSILSAQGRIDFRLEHAPLLFLTGDRDHLTPLDAVRRNARRYDKSPTPVDLEVFTGRGHAICLQPGWEEVADRALAFLAA